MSSDLPPPRIARAEPYPHTNTYRYIITDEEAPAGPWILVANVGALRPDLRDRIEAWVRSQDAAAITPDTAVSIALDAVDVAWREFLRHLPEITKAWTEEPEDLIDDRFGPRPGSETMAVPSIPLDALLALVDDACLNFMHPEFGTYWHELYHDGDTPPTDAQVWRVLNRFGATLRDAIRVEAFGHETHVSPTVEVLVTREDGTTETYVVRRARGAA